MTEKQIEQVRKKIAAVKRELAADKKRWGGYYHDGAGYRYAVPGLFLKIRNYKGAMNYFRWFAKQFPDDICYGDFLLEWALTLFKLGKLEEAGQKVKAAFTIDAHAWNFFYGREVKGWADFAVWVETKC